MQWFKVVTYVLSPLVLALIVGIVLQLSGMWFALIVLGGLAMSIVNSILISLKVMK
jgi:hypothetical protein